MKVDYSKAFIKASKKLSGKTLDNLRRTIIEVKAAKELSDITDCKKLTNFTNTYRIRIGNYRAFFTCLIEVVDGVVFKKERYKIIIVWVWITGIEIFSF